MGADLSGKRLELLKEVLPKLSRVAVLGNSGDAGNGTQLRETDAPPGHLGCSFKSRIRKRGRISSLRFGRRVRGGLRRFSYWGFWLLSERTLFGQEAVKSRLPAMYPQSNYVEEGGLMSYGASFADLERRAAVRTSTRF